MSRFPVTEEKWKGLAARLSALGIAEQDLTERFIRSTGPGGQNVNKVATCVLLTHLPSGISVRCQAGRSQGLNRFQARVRLADKIEEKERGAVQRIVAVREKIRRQKRKRSKRAKEKMLDEKRHHAKTKEARRPPTKDGLD